MAYKHHRRVFVVAKELQSSAVLVMVSVRHDVAVCHFQGCEDCLRRLSETPCDVLIVDLEEAATRALDMVVQAKRIWPWQSCIALVGKGAVSDAVCVTKAGATECIEKPVNSECLLSAIEQGLDRAAALFASRVPLTQTQLTVLHLILAGKTSKDIAERLGRSKRTIDVHRETIFRKLGVRTCIEMMKWAMSMGFCSCEWTGGARDRITPEPRRCPRGSTTTGQRTP